MDTLSVTVRYRPLRIGWCIRAGDLTSLREAWRLSFTMWGGCFNPIIPVDNIEYARALVDLFRVDLLWPVSNDAAVKSFIEMFPHLPNPLFSEELFPTGSNESRSAAILDIYHPMRTLYDNHFKNNPKPEPQIVLYEWDQNDSLADICLSTIGDFPLPSITGVNYLKILKDDLVAERIIIDPKDPFPIKSNNLLTISSLGRVDIEQHYSVMNYWGHPGFYIGSAGDFEDLVNYWNLRATNTHVKFFDPQHADRFHGIRSKWLGDLRARPMGHIGSDNSIAIWSKDRNEGRDLSAFGEGLLICTLDSGAWNGLSLKAPYMYFSEGQSFASVVARSGKSRLSFQLPPKPFSTDTWSHNQHLVISIDPGIGLLGNEHSTLATPYIPDLNEFYGRNCYFDWDKARVEPDALGIISHASIFDLSLNALDVNILVGQIFRVAGITTKPSNPGVIATSLINQMGGGIQDCRPFKIAGVRDLIEDFAPDKSFTRSCAIEKIRARDRNTNQVRFLQYEDLCIEQRSYLSKLTPDDVFSYLLKKGVFRAGLEFYCPSCSLEFWTMLDDLTTLIKCSYCGHQFNITPLLRDRGDWRFRRSGLFGLNNNQEGAIPVVLTLLQLDTMFHSNEMFYTTAMELMPGTANIKKFETDFVAVVHGHHSGRIQIAIGECKTRKSITEDDIMKLKSVVDAFSPKGIEVFVILAKLNEFTQEEIKYATKLNEQHHRCAILLTPRELEPYHLYERTAKELEIDSIAVSFEDMARTTHQIYFQTV